MKEDDIIDAAVAAMATGGALFVVLPQGATYKVVALAKGVNVQEALDAVVEAVEATDGVPSPYCG